MKTATLRASRRSFHLFNLNALGGILGLAALIAILPVSIGLVASLSGLAAGPTTSVDVIDFAARRVVSPQEARALIASGALVLDARDPQTRLADALPQAQAIDGIDLAEDDATLTAKLRALGLSAAQPVVVLGDPAEANALDAQVVGALRSLGQMRAVAVEGGLPALREAGFLAIYPPLGSGDFIASRH